MPESCHTRKLRYLLPSSGQIVGARESLNGRENMARRKEKNGEKSPWGQCLTRPVPNGRRRSAFWLGRKTQKFPGTNQKSERRRPFGTGPRHCPQGLFSPFFSFLRAIFFRPFRLSLAPTIWPWVSEDAKVPFITSHAHHAHVLLLLSYIVLSQSVGLRFIHNSVFSLPSPFVLIGTFV